MEIHPGKGVLIEEVSKNQETLGSGGSFQISEGNLTGRKNEDQSIPCQRQGVGGCQPEPERGKLGPREDIPYQTANRLPVSNQRLPEILDG